MLLDAIRLFRDTKPASIIFLSGLVIFLLVPAEDADRWSRLKPGSTTGNILAGQVQSILLNR